MQLLPVTLELTRDRDQKKQKFEIRLCSEKDLQQILELQELVYTGLEDRQHIFVQNTREEMAESLAEDVCLAAFCGDTVAAFALMVVNRVSDRNVGTYLEYSDEKLRKSVTYDTTFVHPAYRGYGMQKILNRIKDKAAVSMGAEEALSTISPDNEFSLRNSMASGFVIADKKMLYGGKERYILRKDLTK